jgi:glycosyltransferase involved in cell wall biosynthesis
VKIALVCDSFLPRIGGIERHVDELARHLAEADHRVTVITPTKATKGVTTTPSKVRVHRLPARLLPGAGLIWTRSSFFRLGETLRSGGFDLVQVHSSIISPAAYAAIYFAQKSGLPTVSTGHSIWGSFTHAFRFFDRCIHWARWPVAFSSVSERVAREMRPLIAPGPVDVLPNAIDPDAWRLAHRPPAGTINIACVMRLVRRKRGAALIRAFEIVRSQLPKTFDVCLQIAGDGPDRARLEELVRQFRLTGAVRFLGSMTSADVKALLATSHFFVLPSRLEAFGIAALEARATGLPVVAMREGGVGEFISHGQEGLLAGDDGQLATHMLALCVDATLRTAITAHNRTTPVAFTWERTLAAHFATYERARRLCAGNSSRNHTPLFSTLAGSTERGERSGSIARKPPSK